MMALPRFGRRPVKVIPIPVIIPVVKPFWPPGTWGLIIINLAVAGMVILSTYALVELVP